MTTTKNAELCSIGNRPIPVNLEYANAANRIAGTNELGSGKVLTSAQLYQLARQQDDDSIWMLMSITPSIVWQLVSNSNGSPIISVDNIGDLRLLSISSDRENNLFYLGGYTSIGDGGEGLFYLVNDPSLSDNDGTIVASVLADYYFVRVYEDSTIHAAWFGHSADITEANYADNDSALENAINALPSDGGVIMLGTGTFWGGLIECGENTILKGHGRASEIKLPGPAYWDILQNLSGITHKDTGVTHFEVRDLAYNGNDLAHQSYYETVVYPAGGHDFTQAHGVYIGAYGGKSIPNTATLDNLYIHNCVRNPIVFGDCNATITKCELKDSLSDHLLYCSTHYAANISDIVLSGYWRQGGVIIKGQNMNNVVVQDVADVNPTYAVTSYIMDHPFQIRPALSGSNIETRMNNIDIHGVKQASLNTMFNIQSTLKLSNCTVVQTDSATATGNFTIFTYSPSTKSSLHSSGLAVRDVKSDYFRLFRGGGTTSSGSVDIINTNIDYDGISGTGTRTSAIIQFITAFTGTTTIDNLTVNNDSNELLSNASTLENVVLKNINMLTNITPTYSVLWLNPGAENIIMHDSVFSDTSYINVGFLPLCYLKNCRFGSLYSNTAGKYTYTFPGAATQSITIPHNLIGAPLDLDVTPANERASIDSAGTRLTYYATVDTTNITITFDHIPTSTDDIEFWFDVNCTTWA